MMFDFAAESGLYMVKSPLNYVGGKFKLLKQLLQANGQRDALIPADVDTFVDVFCGGFNVGANASAKNVVAIDLDKDVIDLLTWIRETPTHTAIATIKKIKKTLDLDKHDTYEEKKAINALAKAPKREILAQGEGVEDDIPDDEAGDPRYNLENDVDLIAWPIGAKGRYIRARFIYNKARKAGQKDVLGFDIRAVFYTLICHGFNSHIRFGPNGYNIPFGIRTFNDAMERNFSEFSDRLQTEKPTFVNAGFTHAETLELGPTDYVYFDPPYLITTAPYNKSGKGWGNKEETELYAMLDRLDAKGVRFGLSNVIEHTGRTNDILAEWSSKYVLHDLRFHYDQASYNLKMSKEERATMPTREVFVTNVRG